jgi:class 3 adenylate cyclase/tetratricopeptide (TPR) repeat protein
MKCPKCQFENPNGLKFCNECGQKLTIICPSCNAVNQPGSKFCGDCGHNLTLPSEPTRKELSFDEKLEKIQKYLPKGITEKILSQRDKIEGEKRQVTVIFCDMKGFTPLSEKLGPEAMYAMMDEVYEILIHRVHAYEGTVNEMTGDGVMALFGAPIAVEDAPQRALRSAMSIHREMTRFNEKLRSEHQSSLVPPSIKEGFQTPVPPLAKGGWGDFPALKMRIGIHTGPVVVGTLGNDLRVEFKAVGDTVNLAARMEQLAEPGTTYVTEDTFKLTEGYFRFEALGEKEIKGKEKSLKVYRVIAPSTRRTRFDVSAERGLTPFVGRQRELELLLDGFERSKESRGQAISIISEAGIGKSRLLYEFRKAVTNEDITFLEGRCLSYSRNIAYHPIVDVLRANFDIQDTDIDQVVREKVTRFLSALNIEEASTLPYLLELLSVKNSGIDKLPMSPEARKDRTLEALKRITLKGAELRHVIMAIEDLHWMDRSSEDALKELLESIPGARVFLIFTYRPEFIHTWGSRSYHSQVMLNRLSNRESLAMIEHVLATRDIDRHLEDLILQKAEGIPFFIEEFIKSLKDLKIIECRNGAVTLIQDIKSVSIPSTIQEVIMSRIDKLPEGAREVLRTGSVIEREFSHELLKKVTELPEQDLLSHLSILKDSELLYERGIYPHSTYIFKHALTREVAYDSILTKRKKQLHTKIAGTIEDIYKEDICYHYGVLAGHCIAGEDFEKGAEYARLEAKRYQKAGSLRDAISYAEKSIACLERLPQAEHIQKKIIDTRVVLSAYYLSVNYHIDAKEAVEPIVDVAVGLNYQKRLPGIYTAIGLYNIWIEEDFSKGVPYLKEVFEISTKVGDVLALWFGNYQLGCAMSQDYQFEESMAYLKTSLDLSVMANNLIGISHTKSAIAMNYYLQGKTDLALQACKETLQAATASGDIQAKQPAYTNYGVSCYYKGHLDEAEKYLLEGLVYYEKASQSSWGGYASYFLGLLYNDMGNYDKAKKYCQQCVSIMEDARFSPSWLNCQKLGVENHRILNGEHDIDIHKLGDLIKEHENNRLAMSKSFGSRFIGEIFLHIDDHHMSEAETWIMRSIDFDLTHAIPWNLGKDYVLYAEWFKKKGDVQGAKEQLTKAIDLFRECGADGWVERTEKILAEI